MSLISFSNFAHSLTSWIDDENGNVTVDWTVLLAGMVGLSLAVMLSLGGGVEQLADKTEAELSTRDTSSY